MPGADDTLASLWFIFVVFPMGFADFLLSDEDLSSPSCFLEPRPPTMDLLFTICCVLRVPIQLGVDLTSLLVFFFNDVGELIVSEDLTLSPWVSSLLTLVFTSLFPNTITFLRGEGTQSDDENKFIKTRHAALLDRPCTEDVILLMD
jgi:hypothetical protein